MTQRTSITNDETSSEPVFAREGDQVAYVIPVAGVVTGITSPTMTFYKDGGNSDLSSTYWTGSMSVSGVNSVLTKTTQNLKAGNWIISIFGTVDGQVQNIVTIPFIVKRKGEK